MTVRTNCLSQSLFVARLFSVSQETGEEPTEGSAPLPFLVLSTWVQSPRRQGLCLANHRHQCNARHAVPSLIFTDKVLTRPVPAPRLDSTSPPRLLCPSLALALALGARRTASRLITTLLQNNSGFKSDLGKRPSV